MAEVLGDSSRMPTGRITPCSHFERYGGELLWDCWYNVIFSRREGRDDVNIATPVEFDGAQFHYIDLDLDVWRFTNERSWLLDEDEFLAHSETMRYPADVISGRAPPWTMSSYFIADAPFHLIEDDARRPGGDGTERAPGDECRRAPARGPA